MRMKKMLYSLVAAAVLAVTLVTVPSAKPVSAATYNFYDLRTWLGIKQLVDLTKLYKQIFGLLDIRGRSVGCISRDK